MVAAYASERSVFALLLTAAIGLCGFLLSRFGYPVVPVLLGLLLGSPLETNFRRALLVSDEGGWIFVRSPISAGLLVAAAAGLAVAIRNRAHREDES